MCSAASVILTSIATILVSFEATLIFFKAYWLLKLIFTEIIFKIASKLTSIVAILVSVTIAGEHIFQVLDQYLKVLSQYLQVLPQYLRELSRWIHPKTSRRVCRLLLIRRFGLRSLTYKRCLWCFWKACLQKILSGCFIFNEHQKSLLFLC